MDIRQTLMYGACIGSKYFLFGDNRFVATSAILPHSTLNKHHNILAFHRVWEAIAAKLMAFYWFMIELTSSLLRSAWSCAFL